MAELVRIQKALADAGVASRRAADELVAAGRVAVNGAPASVGQRVDVAIDRIAVDGRPIAARPAGIYLAMSKPPGVTSTVSDRHAQRTVVELVPAELRGGSRVYPVGRLDRDSEGLLLLTNDGGWAQRVLHPRHDVEREYAVGVPALLTGDHVRALRAGVELEEGIAALAAIRLASAAETARLEASLGPSARPLTWYRVVLTQGWRRQIRRMFATLGVPVARLVRVRIGPLRLEGMRAGEVRSLSAAERDRLVAGTPEGGAGRRLVVALDGPGSSGKSTVGAIAAGELGYRFCDTGVLYRGLAWLALERHVDPSDEATLLALVGQLQLEADEQGRLRRLVVAGSDVTERLHAARVDAVVSAVASLPAVRGAFLPVQRDLVRAGGIIMAGRDIGTVVLPDADLKLYLDVSLEERARRRAADRRVRPGSADEAAILAELRRRDGLDSTRAVAPLRIADDAVIVRGDGRSREETVAEVVRTVRRAAAHAGGAAR